MASDLHMHTTYSDGKLTPEELVAAAKTAGLHYIAITDHDTVEGVAHLYENGYFPCKGIHVIPGIEFSAHHPTQEIHILGYNIDIYNGELADKLNDVSEARWSRFSEMVEKIQKLGYDLRETDVLAIAGASKSISRSHMARALMKKGYFKTVREAFDELLKKGKPAYVPHYRLDVECDTEILKYRKVTQKKNTFYQIVLSRAPSLSSPMCRNSRLRDNTCQQTMLPWEDPRDGLWW